MRVFLMGSTRPFASRWGILLIKIPTSMQKGEYSLGLYSNVSPSLYMLTNDWKIVLSRAKEVRNMW